MEDVRLPESTGVVPLSAAHGNELLRRVRSRVSLCRLCHLSKASPGTGEMASSLSHLPLTPQCGQNHRKPANKGGGKSNLRLSSPCSEGEGTVATWSWEACSMLVPQPGIKPTPLALKVWSLNHRTSREVLNS